MTVDVALALSVVALAGAWLARRVVRTFVKRKDGCACPSAGSGSCGAAASAGDLRAAAARGAAKATRTGVGAPPPA